MRTFTYLCLGLGVFASVGLVTFRGAAQEEGPHADSSTKELIQRGIALRRVGQDEEALALFREAEHQSPSSVRILLHITTAAQATGRWVMAYQYLQKAAAYRTDPYYQRYRAPIRNIEETVAQHIAQFRALGSPEGAEVLLNGERVGTLPMGDTKVVELGSYVLEVRKAGYYPMKRPLNVVTGGTLIQEAIDLKMQPPAQTGFSQASGAPPFKDFGAAAEERRSDSRWLTWSLAGVGVALGAASGAAFYWREREAEHWNDDSRCLEGTLTREQVCGDVREDAERAEKVGLVTGGLAAAFGGAALLHWLLSDSPPAKTKEAASSVSATCDAGLGNLVCHGSF